MTAASLHPPLVLTDDQFEDMTRKGAFTDVGRVELRGGVLTPMSPVYLRHAAGVGALLVAIQAGLAVSGLGLTTIPEITIRFGRGFQPTADIVVWDPAGVAADYDGPLPAHTVKLVVEVADASLADDLGAKAVDYARAGVAEYWVADVKSRTLFLHRGPGEAGYAERRPHAFGATVAALTLPLTVDTAAL